MKKILSIIGYIWAVLCLLLIPITFVGNNAFASMLAKLPFMKVNPIFSGGEADRTIDHVGFKTTINKPVFEALIGESSKGFVQVKWTGDKMLPPVICDTIDYDHNGTRDFIIHIDTHTGKTELTPLEPHVLSLQISSRVKDSWVARINLQNPAK